MHKKKYDLIFSIGETCLATQVLRNSELQSYSYPFDWVGGGDFLNRVSLLCNDFKNFINKEDLVLTDVTESIKTNIYTNKRNGMGFNHDFLAEITIDEAYPFVLEKYERRIKRLLDFIKKSDRVLVLFVESLDSLSKVTNEMLKEAQIKLHKRFGPKIDILCIQIEKKIKFSEKEDIYINPYVRKITFDYKSYGNENHNLVDFSLLAKAVSEYRFNDHKIITEFKKKFFKYISLLIPIKKYRKTFRGRFEINKNNGFLPTDKE